MSQLWTADNALAAAGNRASISLKEMGLPSAMLDLSDGPDRAGVAGPGRFDLSNCGIWSFQEWTPENRECSLVCVLRVSEVDSGPNGIWLSDNLG